MESEILDGGFDVTAITRLKHSELWECVKKFGTQAALARHLEVGQHLLSTWINFKSAPPPHPTRQFSVEKLAELESRLYILTGKNLDELFPESLRELINATGGMCRVESRTHVDSVAAIAYSESTKSRLVAIGHKDTTEPGQIETVQEALNQLTVRERKIVEMRFGLNGNDAMTYEDVGRKFKVTRERIRQVEQRAIRKLKEIDDATGHKLHSLINGD